MAKEHSRKDNWKRFSDVLRKKYPSLTDEDLAYNEEKEQEVLSRLQDKLGLTSHDIEELMMSGSRPEDTYDITANAFKGLPENDPDNSGMTGTYDSDHGERDKLPRTHAPRSQGYDNGKGYSGSDTDPRR
jgi:hypothetical protein